MTKMKKFQWRQNHQIKKFLVVNWLLTKYVAKNIPQNPRLTYTVLKYFLCSSNAALIGKCDSKKGQVMCDMRINVDQIVISIFLGSTTPMLPMHAVYSPCISHSNIIFGQTVHSYS